MEDARTMARPRWSRKCSELDSDENRDSLPSAGLSLPLWKSSLIREYQGWVQTLAASCATPIVTRAGTLSWLDSLVIRAAYARLRKPSSDLLLRSSISSLAGCQREGTLPEEASGQRRGLELLPGTGALVSANQYFPGDGRQTRGDSASTTRPADRTLGPRRSYHAAGR